MNEKRGITADTALRLSRYFGTTSLWMNMQASYELEIAEDRFDNGAAPAEPNRFCNAATRSLSSSPCIREKAVSREVPDEGNER